MKIGVVGSGYVGLVTGACFAEFGNEVTCVDVDVERIGILQLGGCHIYEPGLLDLMTQNRKKKRLFFTSDFAHLSDCRIIFICVGTPSAPDGSADLRALHAAINSVDRCSLIAIKSTVPAGTARDLAALVHPRLLLSIPEFLKEGTAIEDFMRPDRIVVGMPRVTRGVEDLLHELYAPFLRTGAPLLFMSNTSAELVKSAANGMLLSRISYMNEIAALCEKIAADVDEVRQGVGTDKRIGPRFLFPGVGAGGSCFRKDSAALIALGTTHGIPMQSAQAAIATNGDAPRRFVARILSQPSIQSVGVWGLSFKPGTDDIREAPSLVVLDDLLRGGYCVRCHDPVAMQHVAKHFEGNEFDGHIAMFEDPYTVPLGVDALVLLTEWPEYRQPDWWRLHCIMRGNYLFDGRNVWNKQAAELAGFVYQGVGR